MTYELATLRFSGKAIVSPDWPRNRIYVYHNHGIKGNISEIAETAKHVPFQCQFPFLVAIMAFVDGMS